MVRPGDGDPLTLDELVDFLGRTRCQVRIQPVLDPTEVAPIDGYEVPQRLRAVVRHRQIADVFPFGTCRVQIWILTTPSDMCQWTTAGRQSDPAGQSGSDGPSQSSRGDPRREDKHQPEPGYFVHRSPNGYVYLVTNQGTLALGRTDFGAAVWEASAPKPAAIPA